MNDRLADRELLDRQRALQLEAEDVAADLGIRDLVEPLGQPFLVGSAALGLMVWRDLDFTVVCRTLDVDAVVAVGARLATHPRIRQVVFRNDTGKWNTDPAYPDGLYLGLSYRSPAGNDWKSDIWFVDQPERQPDLSHVSSMPSQLTDEIRAAILRIKSAWASRPEYGKGVLSFDIYTAVIDGGVRTLDDFAAWLAERGEQ
jgi:hypothetical protein